MDNVRNMLSNLLLWAGCAVAVAVIVAAMCTFVSAVYFGTAIGCLISGEVPPDDIRRIAQNGALLGCIGIGGQLGVAIINWWTGPQNKV